MGHDRWIADLRSLLDTYLHEHGRVFGLCAHPYDLCTELIAREAGLVITNERGTRLSAPLDVTSPVGWIGYANRRIFSLVAPVLHACIQKQGLLPETATL